MQKNPYMAYSIIADFFNFFNPGLFDAAALLLAVSFIIWELPRSVKMISEEYTKGLYPETGRVMDFAFLAIGLAAILYIYLISGAERVSTFLRTPGITSLFLVILVVIPLLIFMGFLKRFFARFDAHNSVTVFMVQGFLDFMHTLFFISAVVLAVPALGHAVMGG
jgi:hypothetical protein